MSALARGATTVLALLFGVLAPAGAPLAQVGVAAAGTTTPVQQGPTTQSPPTQSPPAQGPLSAPRFVTIQVSSVSPSTVMSTTTEVTVRGSLRNTGDRDVHELDLRLERAPAVRTAAELRTALRTGPLEFDSTGPFTRIATQLSPGDAVDFTLTLPVSGRAGRSLALTDPGVYPVQVNVNGRPDFGSTARLDVVHFLLPVQSLPATPAQPAGAPPGVPAGAPPGVPAGAPPALTLLWPLADRPRLLPVAPGEPPLLSDDELATSLAPGGRLYQLLNSLSAATSTTTDPDRRLRNSVCLALDPDLLVTAEAMAGSGGYRVQTAAGGVSTGSGGQIAASWLTRLRGVAADTCVMALPWAQLDINAAARAGLGDQVGIAVNDGSAAVGRITGVPGIPGLTWPTSGALTTGAAAGLAALGQSRVLLSADAVTGAANTTLAPTQRLVRTTVDAATLATVLLDPPSAVALAATGAAPRPGDGPAQQGPSSATRDGRTLALQDALGALSWPALVGVTGAPTGAPSTVVLAPPQTWTVDGGEATTVLQTVRSLLSANLATSQSLPALVGSAATGVSGVSGVKLDYPLRATSGELPSAITDAVVRAGAQLASFAGSARADVQAQVQPAAIVDPLRQDLVRSLSSARDAPPASGVGGVLTRLLSQVSLQTPGGPYTLASEQSPLLLVVRNDLPVAMDIHVSISGPPGLQVTDVGVQQLPARSQRQLMLPTSVTRAGQFAVDVSLTTVGGQSVGPSTRLLVRSTAYGTATAALTGGAALLLLVLVTRRLWHRFRGQPDSADEGRVMS